MIPECTPYIVHPNPLVIPPFMIEQFNLIYRPPQPPSDPPQPPSDPPSPLVIPPAP